MSFLNKACLGKTDRNQGFVVTESRTGTRHKRSLEWIRRTWSSTITKEVQHPTRAITADSNSYVEFWCTSIHQNQNLLLNSLCTSRVCLSHNACSNFQLRTPIRGHYSEGLSIEELTPTWSTGLKLFGWNNTERTSILMRILWNWFDCFGQIKVERV